MADSPNTDGTGKGFRIVIKPEISVGALLQITVVIVGGIWALAHLDAAVTALSASFSDFKNQTDQRFVRLEAKVDTKQDKPLFEFRP